MAPASRGGRMTMQTFHGQKTLPCFDHRSGRQADRKGKGKETKLCFIGHGLMENRHGLLIDACLTQADRQAERVDALHMIGPRADRATAIRLDAKSLRCRTLRQRAALDERDAARCTEHQRP